MKGVFKGLIGLFTRNWGLKLLALTLSIVIYYSLKPAEHARHDTEHEQSFFNAR